MSQPQQHRCEVCGERGSFGVGVSMAKGRAGRWYCAEHLPAEHRPPGMGPGNGDSPQP